jgi:hypothetical protein
VIDVADVGFEPVVYIRDGGDVPREGRAFFRGVLYEFNPSTVRLTWPPPGLLCDLLPVDSRQGLPMLAAGEFRRSASSGVPVFEVHWTSLGSRELVGHPEIGRLFADFLERLAAGEATGAHWDAFAVNHYADAAVEDVRRKTVQMFVAHASLAAAPEERDRLLSWASALRRRFAR